MPDDDDESRDPLSGETATGGSAAKKALRQAVLAKRDALDEETRARAAAAIARAVVDLRPDLPSVAGYWPWRSEADPRPAMEALAARGVALALPVIAHPHMRFLRFSFGDPMVEAGFGTLGPPHDAPEIRPAALLVPLACFDARCNRVGWGKGHYDRAIERLHADGAPLFTIGIAFALQEVEAAPVEPHDRPLDVVVTERGILRRLG
jgi:5-formyltetrahydrofolate cyclo-ligase